ncbi:MAG: hypothetical protein EXS10_10770 [Phycisphaerales bacterium]|nr:hypothetical protein [Phycisphaerales bacterium]
MKLFHFITTHALASLAICTTSSTVIAQNPPGGGQFSGRGQALGTGSSMQVFDRVYRPGVALPMGAGNVMDANTRVGSFGSNDPTLAAPNYNARNLVVTNSVPGGRGFRGSVGYAAAGDFEGATGSDSTYGFRAGSAFSNPAFIQSGLTNDRFLIGQGLGVFEYRRDSTPIGVEQMRTAEGQSDSRLRLDRMNTSLSIGRQSWDVGEDRLVANGQGDDGSPLRFTISPLRGMQLASLRDPLVASSLPLFEMARVRNDFRLGLTTPEELLPRLNNDALATVPGLGPMVVDVNAEVSALKLAPRSYKEILTTIVQAYEKDPTKNIDADPAALARVRGELARLRGDLEKGTDANTPMHVDPSQPIDPTKPVDPNAPTPTTVTKPTDTTPPVRSTDPPSALQPPKLPGDAAYPSGEKPEHLKPPAAAKLSIPELAEILRHSKHVTELAAGDRMRVDELIRLGEASLRAGEYFRAEERFQQSQTIAAKNPLAEAGIANAQLGAGLYLSTALTLRNLFASNPELIDVTYDRSLLPSDDRMIVVIEALRGRIAGKVDAADFGFTLAYIGKQTSQPALITEGLAQLTGNPQRDMMRDLLTRIWMPSEVPTVVPVDAPTEAPTEAPTKAPSEAGN